MEREKLNEISEKVVCPAINVHRELGPGLLESIYEVCLWKELASSNLDVQRQVGLPVMYKGEPLLMSFRMDLLVEKEIIVELKAVEAILPVHEAQLLTYLRLADKRLGLLMNFNVPVMKDGIKRRVNRF
jgi:GxxExxY protein